MITKITFAIQCVSIVMALILAHEYHHAKAANARQLATAIAEARDEAWELAQNKDYQYAIYQATGCALHQSHPGHSSDRDQGEGAVKPTLKSSPAGNLTTS